MLSLVSQWAVAQRRRGVLESSISSRCARIRRFEAYKPLDQATRQDVEQFLDLRKIGARTRNLYLSDLHCFYAWAIDEELLTSDPTRRIIRPKMRRHLPRPIDANDLSVALDLALPTMRAMLELMAFAGLRCAEVANLDRENVLNTNDPPMLLIRGKGEKERLVPLRDRVFAALRLHGLPRTGAVFVNSVGARIPAARLSRNVALYFDDLGVDATGHQLRHFFATQAYRAVSDILVIQNLLGHSSPTTTAVYTPSGHRNARSKPSKRSVCNVAPMKLAAIVFVLLLVGCGSNHTTSFKPPKGAVQVEAGVWKLDRMLYGTDCARLTALTKEGQPYGPSPRRADGSYTPGFGTVCTG